MHLHEWSEILTEAKGYYRKDVLPDGSAFVWSGPVRACRCGQKQMKAIGKWIEVEQI